jgi:molybdopterin-containing oxidoreductase family iron-sulfur binding subunit
MGGVIIMSTQQFGIVIDIRKCMGCSTCAVVCKMENNLSQGNWWNRILTNGGESPDSLAGSFGAGKKTYIPLSCQHCANPACVRACPVQATYKDTESGIVHQDYNKCIGCRMCIAACPYTGVRLFNWEEPSYPLGVMTGGSSVVLHQKHTVEKCTLCSHRIADGEEPMCVIGCPAYARYFGDLDDPASEVSQLIATREYKQLLPEEGTNPSVYYLV